MKNDHGPVSSASSDQQVEDLENTKSEAVSHQQNSMVYQGETYVLDTDEEKKLVRKIDLFLLPSIWLMYLLSYMDRTK